LAGIALTLLIGAIIGLLLSATPEHKAGFRMKPLASKDANHIAEFLRQVPLFSQQQPDFVLRIANKTEHLAFSKGAILIKQGDVGDTFYVITEGQVEVVLDRPSGVQDRVAVLGQGDSFGETALLENVPRTATIRAMSNGAVCVLGKKEFDTLVKEAKADDLVAFIRGANVLHSSPLFAELKPEARAQFLHRAKPVKLKADEVIIRRGEAGNRFYVVLEGNLDVLGEDDKTTIASLKKGDPFGEIALLSNKPRTATVVARSAGSLLALDRDDFFEFMKGHMSLGRKLEQLGADRLTKETP
jgi:CRP-like cAMP-binding protein